MKLAKKKVAKKAPAKKKARAVPAIAIPTPDEVLGEPGADLSEKQREFCHMYAANPNATRCYLQVFPTPSVNTARTEGSRLLQIPAVKEYVAVLRKELLDRYDVTNDRIIEELARIAFVDLGDLYGEDGKLLAVKEMPEHARRAVAGIEVDELFEGSGKEREQVGFTSKVKLSDKRAALFDLAKIKGMVTDKTQHDVTPELATLMRQAEERLANAK